eukprot:12717808-Ditylum_brightwellii.AAC.1
MLITYDYDNNAIIARPLKEYNNTEMLACYKEIYKYLTEQGFKPELNVMDNKASQKIKAAIIKTGATYQLCLLYTSPSPRDPKTS